MTHLRNMHDEKVKVSMHHTHVEIKTSTHMIQTNDEMKTSTHLIDMDVEEMKVSARL